MFRTEQDQNRREFLQRVGLLLLAAFVSPSVALGARKKREYLLLNHGKISAYDKRASEDDIVVTPAGDIRVLHLETDTTTKFATAFYGHILAQDMLNPTRAATFEQYGTRGVLTDFLAGKILASISCAPDTMFLGHASFHPHKKVVFTTEHDISKKRGQVTVRDSSSLKALGSFGSNGFYPHDCRLLNDGKTFVAINPKGPSNIAWLDTESEKVQESLSFEKFGAEPSHFDISHDGWICGIERKRTEHGRVLLASPGKDFFELTDPTFRKKEMKRTGVLSVAFLGDSGLLAATFPEAGCVRVWKYKTQEFLGSLTGLENARGVLFEPAGKTPSFYVSGTPDRSFWRVDVDFDKGIVGQRPVHPSLHGNGSHLVRVFA